MPRRAAQGVFYTDKASAHLALVTPNLRTGLANSVQSTAAKVQVVITKRVRASATATGMRRKAGVAPRFKTHSNGRAVAPGWALGKGPGREETGALINSNRVVIKGIGTGKVAGQVGYIKPVSYLAYQERIAGLDGKPLASMPLARVTARALFRPTAIADAQRAMRLSSLGRTMKLDR